MAHLMSQWAILRSYNYQDIRELRRGVTGHYRGVLLTCTFLEGWAENPKNICENLGLAVSDYVEGSACPAARCTSSKLAPLSSAVVMNVARIEWAE
jgi:hypothetical protein